MILRPYQSESVDKLSNGFKDHKRQVLALTTGGGKTIIFSDIAKRAISRNKRVLILTHRTELFTQATSTFSKIGLEANLIQAKQRKINTDGLLHIAMVETIKRREHLIKSILPDLIIIDECHIGNFTKVLDLYPDTFTLGVTATPVGKHFYKYYTNIVQTIDTPDLVNQGFLVECKPYQMVSKMEGLKLQAGEYTESSQFEFFDKPILYDGVVEQYNKFVKGKKTLIFNCNIEHSNNMAKAFNDAGIHSLSLTSKCSLEERKEILTWFESTPDAVLNNNGILTAGYDHPPIECIIVNRATASLPLWLQMCGRGSRTYEGKENFTVLDFGANHNRHGLWNQKRDWEIAPPKKEIKKEAPIKECPRCSAMLPVSLTKCNFCGYEYPIQKKVLQTDGEMLLFKQDIIIGKKVSQLTIDEAIIISQSNKKYSVKTMVIWRYIRSLGVDAVIEYGSKMGYHPMWKSKQIEQIDNNQFYNSTIKWKQ